MKLEMARHPCLEVQDDVAFIANDITLERGIGKLFKSCMHTCVNPLSPKNDQHEISPCNMNAL